MRKFSPLFPLLLLSFPAMAWAAPAPLCAGWPRLALQTPPGLCVGVVIEPVDAAPPSRRTVKLPRALLPLPDGDWLISDLGGWDPGRGAVWRLKLTPQGPQLTRLLRGLDLPHSLALGTDGRVYLGQMGRIVRFDPAASDPAASLEVVIGGLPDTRTRPSRHPLAGFLFDANGDLLVDVGAPSDDCLPSGEVAKPGQRCDETGPEADVAVVRRYRLIEPGRWSQTPEVVGFGLRNSLALARAPSGVVLQGENSADLPDADRPFDELNLLDKPGRNYGWPYCMNRRTVAPAWAAAGAMDCSSVDHAAPTALLPPHGAPLAMLYYDGPLKPLKGRLLVGLHGYRPTGGRLLAVELDARGVPVAGKRATFGVYEGGAEKRVAYPAGAGAVAATVAGGWDATRRKPMMTIAGLAVAKDGSVWIADDVNGRILRLAEDR